MMTVIGGCINTDAHKASLIQVFDTDNVYSDFNTQNPAWGVKHASSGTLGDDTFTFGVEVICKQAESMILKVTTSNSIIPGTNGTGQISITLTETPSGGATVPHL